MFGRRDKNNGNVTGGKTMSWNTAGKSAYQIWLAQGNTGSEATFLASLKGPKGEPGTGTGGVDSHSLYAYYQPKPELAANSSGRVNKEWTLEQYYAMYDGLMAANPKYIRKEIAPYKDMSGGYDLVRYVFEPEDGYEKTIYIGAGVHASEMAAKLGLARICQLVCEEWASHVQLTYMRKNVRMVIIPFINPWGHERKTMVNSNGSANTANSSIGVNCNRNYDGFWGQIIMSGGADHNGAAPFSENETKWVRDTILHYGPENFHYGFDFHDAGTRSVQGDFWINYNTFHKGALRKTRPLNWYLAKKYITNREPFIWHDKDTTTSGVFPVWAGRVMGIPASTVEHCYEGGGAAVFDSAFMTQVVDTYINAVLINTIADHKSPVFTSNAKWFNLEWWKASGEQALEGITGRSWSGSVALWDELVSKYPKYMKKSGTAVASSDGNQVYHYTLSPRNYTKTVLVVGGRTEPNREPFVFSVAMLRLANLLCTHGEKDSHLSKIKDNVRVVFVPYLEYTTKYLNSAGYWAADGTPATGQINVTNIVSIMDSLGTIDGVIYQRELNKTDILAAATDDSFVLASQDVNDKVYIESYVDHLKTKGLVAEFNRSAVGEFANYVFNKRNISCVRIDTGLDHKTYDLKKFQFDDQYGDVAVSVDLYLRFNHEIARRITNIVNVIKLMT